MVHDNYEQNNNEKAENLKKFIQIYQNSEKVKQELNADIGEKLWFKGWK